MTTTTRVEVQRLADAGKSISEIAEAVGVSRTRVYQLLEALGYEHVPATWRKKEQDNGR